MVASVQNKKKDDEDHQKKKKEMPGLGAKPLWSPLPCDHNHAGSWVVIYLFHTKPESSVLGSF